MTQELIILGFTAASIGFIHTLLGPDHYLPFIAIAKARDWSLGRTALLTLLCGIGHVGSSILLGMIGVALGIAVTKLEFIESIRGDAAAWFLIAFGFVYCIWGLRKAIKDKMHHHIEPHEHGKEQKNITPWILFIVFVLGPCEPLIPILMYPAAKHSVMGLLFVTSIFAIVTIITMLSVVVFATFNLRFVVFERLERFAHLIAGAVIFFSGIGIKFLGL